MTWYLAPHILGGGLGLLAGAVALVAAKGSRPHRLAGHLFLASMLLMTVTGGIIAAVADIRITVLAAALTAYLVSSGWLAASRAEGTAGAPEGLALVAGLAVAGYGVHLGIDAGNGRADVIDGTFVVPAGIYFTFAGLAALGAATDAWTLARRGLTGRSRILRHLWRMCAALYIAASSFFTGQQDVFPEALRGSLLLQAPENLVLALLLFWLARVALSKRYASASPVAAE